eukprot:CCRYP_009277-RA/>CCRYP_009277-RA protein AED:0.01 eAED:-0.00 QI:0/-1/0/1/-1/0/1/0/400
MSSSNTNNAGSIICAGLSCLDLQLLGCTKSGTDEAIERYDDAVHCAGGSASMTGTTLALLLGSTPDEHKEEVHILTKIGMDFAGDTLVEFYRRAGASTRLVLKDPTARTSMAVLPVYQNGKRGCFVNLACNDEFEVNELMGQLENSNLRHPRAFLFGYPHLLPKMQGKSLNGMLAKVREKLSRNGQASVLIGVDLNGVDGSDRVAAQSALVPALSQIDVLHLNEDEAAVLTSSTLASNEYDVDPEFGISAHLLRQITSFHDHGCAVVLLSLGSKGAFVSVTPHAERLQQLSSAHQPYAVMRDWTPGTRACVPAFKISHGEINANGAGDALFSGFCLAASSWAANKQSDQWKVTPEVAAKFASLVAWQRCDVTTRDGTGMKSADLLMDMLKSGDLPEAIDA